MSLSLSAQKTSSAIVKDVLTMTGVSGQILGYEVSVVASQPPRLDMGRYVGFTYMPADVKKVTKTNGLISYTLTSASQTHASLSSNTSSTFSNMNLTGVTDINLTLSQSTLAATLSELGSFSYVTTNSTGTFQVTYYLNASMLVLDPAATYPGGTFFGKVPCKVKNMSTGSITNYGDQVIYLTAKHRYIDG